MTIASHWYLFRPFQQMKHIPIPICHQCNMFQKNLASKDNRLWQFKKWVLLWVLLTVLSWHYSCCCCCCCYVISVMLTAVNDNFLRNITYPLGFGTPTDVFCYQHLGVVILKGRGQLKRLHFWWGSNQCQFARTICAHNYNLFVIGLLISWKAMCLVGIS